MLKKSSFYYKMFISYICIIAVVVATVGIIAYYLLSNNMLNERQLENKKMITKMTQIYSDVMQELEKNVYLLTIDENINRYLLYEKNEYNFYSNLIDISMILRDFKTNSDLIHSVYVYSNINEHIVSNEYSTNTPMFYDLQWKKAYDQGTEATLWLKSRTLFNITNNSSLKGENVITLIKKVYSGRLRSGAVILNISQDNLNKQISKYIPEGLVESFIIAGDGEVVSSLNHKNLEGNINNSEFRKLIYINSANEFVNYEGELYQIFKSTLSKDWTHFSVIDYSSYLIAKRNLRNTIILLCFIVSTLAIIVSLYVLNRNYSPLGKFLTVVSSSLKTKVSFECSDISNFDLKNVERMFNSLLQKYTKMEDRIKKDSPIIKERYFKSILLNEKIQYSLTDVNCGEWYDNKIYKYLVLNIFVSEYNESGEEETQYLRLFEVKKEIIKFFNKNIDTEPIEIDFNNISVIYRIKKNAAIGYIEATEQLLIRFYESVPKLRFQYMNSIGIGLAYSELGRAHYSYREALEAVKYKIFNESKRAIYYENIDFEDEFDKDKLKILQKQLNDELSNVDYKKVKLLINEIFNILKEYKVSVETLDNIFTNILLNCMNVIQSNMISIEDIFGNDFSITKKFAKFKSINEMEEFTLKSTLKIIDSINSLRNMKMSNVLVEKCKMIIEKEYSSYDLSLNYISDRLNVSNSYLSRCFKEETKKNISKYIIELRIDKACNLILSTNLKINQIIEKVGYTNSVSFNRVFKKEIRMTPGEYRKMGIKS